MITSVIKIYMSVFNVLDGDVNVRRITFHFGDFGGWLLFAQSMWSYRFGQTVISSRLVIRWVHSLSPCRQSYRFGQTLSNRSVEFVLSFGLAIRPFQFLFQFVRRFPCLWHAGSEQLRAISCYPHADTHTQRLHIAVCGRWKQYAWRRLRYRVL
jgi:hypothetical protein